MPTEVDFWNPPSAPAPFGPYSQVACVKGSAELLFLSGQVGIRPDGSIPPSIAEQYDVVLRTIRTLLIESGSSPANLVKLTTYLVAPIDPAVLRRIRTEILGDIRPAATMLYVPRLLSEACLLEVDAIAVRPLGGAKAE